METNNLSYHLAGIIPVASTPLGFNMPWHDSLMPINDNYHAVERAVHTAAMAGCQTIWVVLHREAQPLIKKKLSSWIYDPTHVWEKPYPFFNKKEIPIYYVTIKPKDRARRDSQAWSVLYGAKIASYVSLKISRWVVPKRFLVVSPYGVVSEESIKESRVALRDSENILYTHKGTNFLDNNHLPFTFDADGYYACKENYRINYLGDKDNKKSFKDIFGLLDITKYRNMELEWHYNISEWDGYSQFIGSEHNKLCRRPKYMVTHKWYGLVKDH
jgi:hypothetical protein